jgi:hypothetical protein
MNVFKVFISGTQNDLQAERQAIERAIQSLRLYPRAAFSLR